MQAIEIITPGTQVRFGHSGRDCTVEDPRWVGRVVEISITGKECLVQYKVEWWDADGAVQTVWQFSYDLEIVKE